MPTHISGKCIDELCLMQAKFAKAGHWLNNRAINDKVFGALIDNTCLKMSIDLLNPKESIIEFLSSLILHEEAYELIESSALSFSILIQFDNGDTSYRYLKGPANHCSHYDGSKVRIHSPDHNLETLGYLTAAQKDNLIVDSKWADLNKQRLTGLRAICKIVKDDALICSGKRGLDVLEDALDISPENNRANSVVRAMFSLHKQEPGEEPAIVLPVPYIGDSFGTEAIIKAVAAKSRLKAKRPFIVRNSVWTNEFTWLECLIANIEAIHGSKIGILCPSWKTRLEVENRLKTHESVGVYLSTDVVTYQQKAKSELGYLIIHQAHSVGVTEAIEWMNEVSPDGCVVLVGDPSMPNLRVRNMQVRKACASILNWFYDRDRYPEYFEDNCPYLTHNPVCLDYDATIFNFFNQAFYNGELINPSEIDSSPIRAPMIFKPIKGLAVMQGCSPYNGAEIDCCLKSIKKLIRSGVDQHRIGVLTNTCAQKKRIVGYCKRSYRKVFVGILQDFEYTIRDYLIISTVETAERASGGKRYLFSDLLYDELCLNLAVTRGPSQIIIIGDKDVLKGLDHWKQLLNL